MLFNVLVGIKASYATILSKKCLSQHRSIATRNQAPVTRYIPMVPLALRNYPAPLLPQSHQAFCSFKRRDIYDTYEIPKERTDREINEPVEQVEVLHKDAKAP